MNKKIFDWNDINGLEKHYYSERLVLRPMLECDVYPMFMATTDPAFNRYLLWDAPSSVEQLSDRIEGILDERRKGRMGVWVAAEITTGAFVALFRAYAIDSPPDVDELHTETGIWLHPNYWLGGLSVEVSSISFDLLFDETPVDVLHASTHRENKAGMGLFRSLKLEFLCDSLREHENGSLVPLYSCCLRRNQWARFISSRNEYEDIKATQDARLKANVVDVSSNEVRKEVI
jgi:RimJ/RimL family protein N-acetyltransferase